MVDKDEILLNSKEVAEILDLSPDTVNELARKSVLPAFKRGRQWRFRNHRDPQSRRHQCRPARAAAMIDPATGQMRFAPGRVHTVRAPFFGGPTRLVQSRLGL